MKYFILFYDVVDDYVERRKPYRSEHFALGKRFAERGELRYGGAYANPANGAALVFRGEDDSPARRFAEADPYMLNGLVTSWTIREWSVAVGADYEGPTPAS